MPELVVRPWSGLTSTEAYAVLALRSRVFVVEQNCAFLDPDGADLDDRTEHYLLEDDEGLAAYLRLLPTGHPDGPAALADGRSVGRVVTRPSARGRGLAGRLVDAVLHRHGREPLTLNAQERLEPWYARYGFSATGPTFVEDGIEHVPMRRVPGAER